MALQVSVTSFLRRVQEQVEIQAAPALVALRLSTRAGCELKRQSSSSAGAFAAGSASGIFGMFGRHVYLLISSILPALSATARKRWKVGSFPTARMK